jgi:hypothetical protein
MRLPAAFGHCAKLREFFFNSGAVNHLRTTHFSTNLHVPGMGLLSQIQLNQTSPNGIFVLLPCLPYCISCGTRSSDVPNLPHYSTKSPKFRRSLINKEKLCGFAQWPKAMCGCGTTSLLARYLYFLPIRHSEPRRSSVEISGQRVMAGRVVPSSARTSLPDLLYLGSRGQFRGI